MEHDMGGPLELLVRPLLRWRLLLAATVLAAVVTTAVSLLISPRYQTSASFIVDSDQSSALPRQLLGLAGQLGIGSSSLGAGGPEFYADLLRSRTILRAALGSRVGSGAAGQPLIEFLDVAESNPARRVEVAERGLRNRVSVSVDRAVGRVDVSVWMPDPQTAQAATDTLLSLVDRFNRGILRSRAQEKREFLERQSKLTADSLLAAEERMARFLEGNRVWEQSAQLRFAHERLARTISRWEQVNLALASELENARIAEVDTRPVLSIVDRPVVPTRRVWPRRKLMVLTVTVATVSGLWFILVMASLYQQQGGTTEDAGRATAIVKTVARDVRGSISGR